MGFLCWLLAPHLDPLIGQQDRGGNSLDGPIDRPTSGKSPLDVLPGDVNDDGAVNS